MSSFSLNTGHQRPLAGFQNRTSDVFASLGDLEKGYDDRVKERGPDDFVDDDRDPSPERNRGGSFKRPAAPLNQSGRSREDSGKRHGQDPTTSRGGGGWRRRDDRGKRSSWHGKRSSWHGKRSRVPDFKVHPERWTEYTLEDTDLSSESGNKRAAVDFFRDLRARKAKEARTEEWDSELYCGKIEFKKPASKSSDHEGRSLDCEKKRSGSYSTVHKMPEYVIGQSKVSKARIHQSAAASTSTSTHGSGSLKSDISLGHLGSCEDGDQVSTGSEAEIEQVPTRSAESFCKPPEGNGSLGEASRKSQLESTSSSVTENEDERKTEEGVPDAEKDGQKEEKVTFKKGKGKRKIRERRDDDG